MVISGDRVPVAAYQAIYHKLTSRVEKLSQTLPDSYIITSDDIIHLYNMLKQSIVQYPVKSSSSTCAVALHKNQRMEPSSFEKFKLFNFSMKLPTSKLSYQLEFMTVLPVEIDGASDIVQRFKVSISIDQDFIEEDHNGIPPYMRGMLTGDNINLVVEYSDYNVGRNLQVAVQDWVSTLKSQVSPKWIKHLDNKSDFYSTVVPRIGLATGFLGLSSWWNPNSSSEAVHSIFIGLGLCVFIYIGFHIAIVELYRQLLEAKPLTFICITTGDKDRKIVIDRRRRRKASLAIGLMVIIGITIPINVFSNAVYSKLSSNYNP